MILFGVWSKAAFYYAGGFYYSWLPGIDSDYIKHQPYDREAGKTREERKIAGFTVTTVDLAGLYQLR